MGQQGAYKLSDAKPIGAYSLADATPVTEPASPAAASSGPDPSSWASSFGRAAFGALASQVDPGTLETVGNGVIGILKGAGHTATTIGDLFSRVPGLTASGNAIGGAASSVAYGHTAAPVTREQAATAAAEATKPEGTAQKVGYGVEQTGEFMLPAGAAERGAVTIAGKAAPIFANAPRLVQAAARVAPRMVTEAAASGVTAAAQGNDPTAAAMFGAAAPVVSAGVSAAAPRLKAAAGKQVEEALGATKERYKAIAARLVPQILKRGIRGSREQILEQAADMVSTTGQGVDDALQAFGARQVGPQPVIDAIEKAKDAFRVTNQAGHVVEVEPRAIKQLAKLQDTITQLGPDATVAQLVAVRRAWDTVVEQAGGFAHRAGGAIGVPLKDTTEAWAKREGAGAIRKLLDAEVPELTAINKEFSFWKNLHDVVAQTVQRKGPQGEGLTGVIKEAAGQAAGSIASGGNLGVAFGLGKVAKMANSIFTSPRWKLASAQAKDALAEAIASNDVSKITTALARISAGATAQPSGAGTR